MATAGELVEVISDVTGFNHASVVEFDRRLAAAGLRSAGGRGRSAAKMTARDGAVVLLGSMLGVSIARVAEATEALANTSPCSDFWSRTKFAPRGWPVSEHWPFSGNLLDVIAQLIEDRLDGAEPSGLPTFPVAEIQVDSRGAAYVSVRRADVEVAATHTCSRVFGIEQMSGVGDHGWQRRGVDGVVLDAIAAAVSGRTPEQVREARLAEASNLEAVVAAAAGQSDDK